jgi:hypothetical protein
MPSLSGVVTRFSQKLYKSDGTIIYGYYRPPQNVRASFDGLFTPRSMLACAPTQDVNVGDCLGDGLGNYFLLGTWATSTYLGGLVAQQFVLFDAPEIFIWQRAVTTIEPVSGLQVMQAPRLMGKLRGLKEPLAKVKDGMDVQLNDMIDGYRVQKVENVVGLSYAEIVAA